MKMTAIWEAVFHVRDDMARRGQAYNGHDPYIATIPDKGFGLCANYGTEHQNVIKTTRLKIVEGARKSAIRWLRNNGTPKDSVTVFYNGQAVGRVFLIAGRRGKNYYAWADPLHGTWYITTMGVPSAPLSSYAYYV